MPSADESAAPGPNPPFASGKDRRTTQPTLHTARLTLVPLTDGHLELEAELDSDAEVMRYLTGRAVSRAEVERAHQRRIAAARKVPGLGFWVGFDRDDFIGWWILQPPHGPDQPKVASEADLGFRLLCRRRRRGYTPSRATMTAVGLTFARAFVSGEPSDDLVPGAEQSEVEYEITRGTWQQLHRRTGP
jgi:hypothetical protein